MKRVTHSLSYLIVTFDWPSDRPYGNLRVQQSPRILQFFGPTDAHVERHVVDEEHAKACQRDVEEFVQVLPELLDRLPHVDLPVVD